MAIEVAKGVLMEKEIIMPNKEKNTLTHTVFDKKNNVDVIAVTDLKSQPTEVQP